MRRLVGFAVAVAIVGLTISVATGAIASPLHSSGKKSLKRGPRGPRGQQGPQGPQGPAGTSGIATLTEVESQHYTLQPGQDTVDVVGNTGGTADCPAGSHVVGTGFNGGIGRTAFVKSYGRFVGAFFYNDTSVAYEVYSQAICASGPGVQAKVQVSAAATSGSRYTSDLRRAASVFAAKTCSAGYTHAVMPGGAHKCLRAGEFCSHKRGYQRVYHQHGYHCKRNGHLTYYP